MKVTPLMALIRKSFLTQERVADTVGVSTGTVRNWGNGKQAPMDTQVARLAKVLGTGVEAVRAAIPEKKKRP